MNELKVGKAYRMVRVGKVSQVSKYQLNTVVIKDMAIEAQDVQITWIEEHEKDGIPFQYVGYVPYKHNRFGFGCTHYYPNGSPYGYGTVAMVEILDEVGRANVNPKTQDEIDFPVTEIVKNKKVTHNQTESSDPYIINVITNMLKALEVRHVVDLNIKCVGVGMYKIHVNNKYFGLFDNMRKTFVE